MIGNRKFDMKDRKVWRKYSERTKWKWGEEVENGEINNQEITNLSIIKTSM